VRKIVLATGNAGKVREFAAVLAEFGLEVAPQSVFNVPEAEETGLTFVENALLKARNAAAHTGLPALADGVSRPAHTFRAGGGRAGRRAGHSFRSLRRP